MPLFTTDILEMRKLDHRILRDTPPPEDIDAICFFGQTKENDRIALKAIAERWKKHPCMILVGFCEPINDFEFVVRGSEAWANDLQKYGVEKHYIEIYQMSERLPPSTDAEALGIVEYVLRNRKHWDRFVITVPPLHAVRAFVSFVSACQKNGLERVKIWSAPSDALDWDEEVCHSGGKLKARRVSHIRVDNTKINTYCLKGDHLTAREILDYLPTRLG